MIRRARVQAGNLAHALKTPLALLLDEGHRLEAAGLSGALVIEQCLRMRRQIDHQLAKTRAEASRVSSTNATPIGPAIGTITATVALLHRDRDLAFEVVNDTPATVVACGAEDLDDILGNLIENATKWARSRVKVVVTIPRDRFVRITVEDDGPGIPVEARVRVFNIGERLDEQVAGTGLGLTIIRDVVGLYGGATGIGDSCLGGAAVFVELPVDGKLIV